MSAIEIVIDCALGSGVHVSVTPCAAPIVDGNVIAGTDKAGMESANARTEAPDAVAVSVSPGFQGHFVSGTQGGRF